VIFLYIAKLLDGSGRHFKVGITELDPPARFAQLQTGNPHPIAPCWQVIFPDRVIARKVEADVHARLKDHRLCGEWFGCGPEPILSAVWAATAAIRHRIGARDAGEFADLMRNVAMPGQSS
jgi:hypothetical protein